MIPPTMITAFLFPSGDAGTLLGLILAAVVVLWIIMSIGSLIQLLFVKGPLMLRPLLREFEETVNRQEKRLLELPESDVGQKPAGGKWSGKEILGHLVDSACNNHQRFIRAQLSSEMKFPAYDGPGWVRVQDYQNEPWPSLVRFWSSYNRHLLHVISNISSDRLKGHCFVGEDMPVTLEFLIREYVKHVNHHLKQI
jgi:DinB superfamily